MHGPSFNPNTEINSQSKLDIKTLDCDASKLLLENVLELRYATDLLFSRGLSACVPRFILRNAV